ncbi:aminopeptidase 2 [Fusarium mexicanum]|uniref:Aminopeptidase n=1 Tax=Fusarium mexicanum TaxID=751941 RepID=A0A8H5MWI9_9HYPO|nr:aminopeptidase 2 [Fusarium mexicanum]
MEKKERILLPTCVKPIAYEIRLDPDFDSEKFEGRVKISCAVLETCSYLELHCKSIKVNAASVKLKDDSWDLMDTLAYDDARETLKIELPQEINPKDHNELAIILSYTGKFRSDLTGLYQASYETDNGVKHRIAATAMEPTYAREVFPCFDEPSMKAEFTLSIVVDESFVAVSNMPMERSVALDHSSRKIVTFQKSISMSTYHLGLVAGPLAEVKCTSSRIPISVFCPLGSEKEATFAVDLAFKGLQFFEDCFELPYPLPKLDLIGVPEFSTGAMENWRAIIFRTTNLLLDPEDSALDTKQRIVETILHEISHMWFGNLVTMKYWDGLWLKEGFATLMSWYAADTMFPSWHFWDSYVADTLQKALGLDSLTSSHAVELFISDPTDAKQIYDEISYQKGSCILRMVLNSLGDTKFFDGLKLYLRRHQFQCTESDDLWKAWEEVTGESMATSMRIWTKQPGFPVLRVSESRDESGKSHELLTHLLEEASKGNLSLRDCIGLSCDLKALVAAGVNKTSELLDLNVKFAELDSFCVWEMIDRNLRSIQSVYKFHEPELNEGLRKLASDVIDPKAEQLGWTISKDDDENLITFKTSMFSGAGLAGYPSAVSAAKDLFAKRMGGDENAIPGSLRWEVFGIVAAHGGLEELEHLVELWKSSFNEDEQYLALECLGRAPNAELMKWVLSHLLTDTVKNHDMFYLTWLAGGTAHGAIELWEWTKQNWERVEKEVPVDIASLFIGTALEGLHTKEQIADVRAFFAARDTKGYHMVLDQNLEGMENRRSWAERDISDVRSWLEGHGYL